MLLGLLAGRLCGMPTSWKDMEVVKSAWVMGVIVVISWALTALP